MAMKIIGPEEAKEKCDLTFIECDCGFHLGLDNSYLDQVGDIDIRCPACEKLIMTSELW